MSKKNFKHLILGAKYKDRDGDEYGPLIENGNLNSNSAYPFECAKTGEIWTKKGRYYGDGEKSLYDLVELVSLPETQAPKRKVTDLGPKEVIHCTTEAEDKAIRELLHAAGEKWCNGQSYLEITHWPNYDCCLPARGETDTLLYYKKKGHTIYPASDFLPQATPATEPETEKVATTPEPQPFIPFEKGKKNPEQSVGVSEERGEEIITLIDAAERAAETQSEFVGHATTIAKTPAEAFLVGMQVAYTLVKWNKKSDREAKEVARSLQDALRKQGIIATVTAEKTSEATDSTEDDCQCWVCRARRKAEEHTHNPYAPVEPVNDAKGH